MWLVWGKHTLATIFGGDVDGHATAANNNANANANANANTSNTDNNNVVATTADTNKE